MNLQQNQQMNGAGAQKRPHAVNELIGRFKSKEDFLKYFKENLQLYTPPDYM